MKEFVRAYLSRDLSEDSSEHLVVCDIDKTYLNTRFSSWRGLVRIPFEWAIDKKPIPGMVPLLRGLRRGHGDEHQAHPLFFVSGSPPELREVISRRMVIDGVEYDGFLFKDQIGCVKRGRLKALTQQVAYKLYALSRLWSTVGDVKRVVMFGDNVEDDPFVFSIFRRILLGEIDAEAVGDAVLAKGVIAEECGALVRDLMQYHATMREREIICIIRKVKGGPGLEFSNGVLSVSTMTQAAYALERRGFIGARAFERALAEDAARGLDWDREGASRAQLEAWFSKR